MLVKSLRRWEMPERDATPEALFLNRRQLLVGGGAGMIAAGLSLPARAGVMDAPDVAPELYPAKRNDLYKLATNMTPGPSDIAVEMPAITAKV